MLHAVYNQGTAEDPKNDLFGDPIFISLFKENSILPLVGVGNASDALGHSYPTPGPVSKKNVILIVVDACRADHLGVLGYQRDTTSFPDILQRSGHLRVVRSYYSASCCTFGGVLTMLRSQHWFKMAPTIHDRLGLPIPPGWDGRSLLRAEVPRLAYLRFGDTYAVVDHTPTRTLKYIYNTRTQKKEVYDDTHDPAEQKNILTTVEAQELEELRQAMLAFAPRTGS